MVLQEKLIVDLPPWDVKHSLLETLAVLPDLANLTLEGQTRAVFHVLDVECSGYLDLRETLLFALWIRPGMCVQTCDCTCKRFHLLTLQGE
jgi:hypothetical protein